MLHFICQVSVEAQHRLGLTLGWYFLFLAVEMTSIFSFTRDVSIFNLDV